MEQLHAHVMEYRSNPRIKTNPLLGSGHFIGRHFEMPFLYFLYTILRPLSTPGSDSIVKDWQFVLLAKTTSCSLFTAFSTYSHDFTTVVIWVFHLCVCMRMHALPGQRSDNILLQVFSELCCKVSEEGGKRKGRRREGGEREGREMGRMREKGEREREGREMDGMREKGEREGKGEKDVGGEEERRGKKSQV